MKFIATLVTFFIGLSAVHCRMIDINIEVLREAEQRGIFDSTVNATVESFRKALAVFDPLSLADLSFGIAGLGDISVSALEAQDFSDFAFTSLSVNTLTSRLKGVLRFPDVSVSLATLNVNADIINLKLALDTLNLGVSGISLDIDTKYTLIGPKLKSLSLLLKIEGVRGRISGSINDQVVQVDITAFSDIIVNVVNDLFSTYQEEISSTVLTLINGILSL